ncbi:DegT/DnrJ/EryC1/StrS family aminotransferase [Tamlana sp. 2_MG-2023]|uniref:DegT/DnrJ/EryC1/StrS family aminotransferase n=1 Tax=unclassified Tamlana TaxID=2614803 RepID=UPI0026E3BE11|nr:MULTISPECIES: DegT/DnrJ/EryC1/StrS family aminotransferase [unclassified Tamlana]MDO6758738.1 DegT/DnrJ/EryC1/StrS family aminotransferase [Tamlana sp. 2_MG-2023]MDO6789437.1 DegT/DnrJ/EryC1/StrS family aminotransferase [Tamlana sp. 1_MG-2023]
MINVTKTFLPPQEEYQAILKRAWDTGWMTNRGVLVKELEVKLKDYLQVPNIIAMTNGTLPLQIAIKALGLTGEIITTPFSYVATTSSIIWEGCTPVFVDIHPEYLTIDETKIEAAITSKTSAILATHVFGNPCDVEVIEKIAKKHDLKIIYDAAHCFGVKYKGQSLFNYGDVSTCSFHATKLFHTGEGGALFCNSEYFETMYSKHNFGHDGPEKFQGLGINAKMSEPQAAMGLAVFNHLNEIFESRKKIVQLYQELLDDSDFKFLKIRESTEWNYHYFPVIFKTEEDLLLAKERLNKIDVFPRRYFYPSLNTIDYLNGSNTCTISESISERVLCLPLFVGLENVWVERIINQIKNDDR